MYICIAQDPPHVVPGAPEHAWPHDALGMSDGGVPSLQALPQ
jgi:hypothetical protein